MRNIFIISLILSFLFVSEGLFAASVSGPTNTCHGEPYSYTFYGASKSYIYISLTGGTFSDGSTIQQIVDYANPVTYNITWNSTNGNGEISYYEVLNDGTREPAEYLQVTVNYFNLSISPASPEITSGSSVTLSANINASSYAWSCNKSSCNLSSTTTKSVDASPTNTTTYYLSASVYYGILMCTKSTSTTVNVIATPISGNTICCEQWFCGSGDPSSLGQQSGTSLSGGVTPYAYQWQHSTNNSPTWANIPGATYSSYDPGILYESTLYRRIVNPGSSQNISNAVVVNVTPNVLNVGSATFSSLVTLKASEQVNISGDISTTSGVVAMVKSGYEINISSPATVLGDFNMFIEPCQNGSSYKLASDNYFEDAESIKETLEGPYPNPISNGKLNFGKKANQFFLYTANGTFITSGTDAEVLDVDGLLKGVYFLIIDHQVTKLVVQ